MHLLWISVVAAAFLVQAAYALLFLTGLRRVGRRTGAADAAQREPVSVVLCARDEHDALAGLLPQLLAQRYTKPSGEPNFELIVADDGSGDHTPALLAGLSPLHPHLVALSLPARGKKPALRDAVAAAKHERLLFTDADCRPAGPDWLARMTAPLEDHSIVAGYGGYRSYPGLLNAFIRWETVHTFCQYAAYAGVGMPYMAVGRNLACRRADWQRAVADPAWNALPYGDDDLLVRACARRGNTAIEAHPGAFTVSEPKRSFADWARQKQRHLSTGKLYRLHHKLLLGGYALSHAISWAGLFTLPLLTGHPLALQGLIILAAFRCLMIWGAWSQAARIAGERFPLLGMAAADLGWLAYNFIFAPYIFWKNKTSWSS